MDQSDLERALAAARLSPSERFELAVRSAGGALLARPFDDPARAVAWLATVAGDSYLGLNPLRPEAAFPPGRARDVDVSVARMLLVDCDPDGTDFAAAAELADTIAARLYSSLRARPAWIHTGRGYQLWLEHEATAPGSPTLAVRARFLRALALRFDLAGRAHVDAVVHNVARLARLPGTVNSRTGAVASIVAAGERAPVLFSDLERLAIELEAEAGPRAAATAPAPRRRVEREHRSDGDRAWPAAYVAAAVRRLLENMQRAAEGARNVTLNRCAFALGQLEAGGARVEAALADLRATALGRGLDEREVERTIGSGWEAGLKEPQAPPPPRPGRPPRPPRPPREGEPPAGDRPPRRERVGLTDLGNARRLLRGHGADLRFCETAGGWFVWDGTRWWRDETGEAKRRARTVPRAIFLRAMRTFRKAMDARATDEEESKRLAKRAEALRRHGARSESERSLRALLALAESEPGIPVVADALDADPWLLNVANGTLDLKTGALRPHAREDLITKLAPVTFDPAATCPTWTAFLDRVLGPSAGLVAFLQRALGYALTGHASEHVLFFLYGTGANGKSTFVETVRALLGDYAATASFETFLAREPTAAPSGIARLRGARFVSGVEAEAGSRFNESLLKSLTGGDTVSARFLYREHFEFRPAFKLFLAANHKPTIRGADPAVWRRIRLVPFTVTVPEGERDKRLKEKLQAELPGILRWAVQGCLAWQRDGLGEPPEVASATAEYRDDMDVLAGFLAERCETFPDSRVGSSQLYKAYVAWAEANGEKPTSQKTFSLRLAERGFARRRSGDNGSREWFGVGLATGQTALADATDATKRQFPNFRTDRKNESTEGFPTDTYQSAVSRPPASRPEVELTPGWTEDPDESRDH